MFTDVSHTPVFFKDKIYERLLPYHASALILPIKLADRYVVPNDHLMLADWYYGPKQAVCSNAQYQYIIIPEAYYAKEKNLLSSLGKPINIAGVYIFNASNNKTLHALANSSTTS